MQRNPRKIKVWASLLPPLEKNNPVGGTIVPKRYLIMNCLYFLSLSNKACQNKLCLTAKDRFGPWQTTKELNSGKLCFYWHPVPPAVPVLNHIPIPFGPVVCELASPGVKSVAEMQGLGENVFLNCPPGELQRERPPHRASERHRKWRIVREI